MIENAKEILELLNKNNYKAYIVGGYVRDMLLGVRSYDIDIVTSATPKELTKLFNNLIIFEEYGAVKLNYKGNIFDITTFRKDIKYGESRKNVKIEYTNLLEEDIKRRDFTINTLYMDKDENIIDLYNAKEDIYNKIIKVNGNITKLIEDPLRILRAIRYASKLNFKLEDKLYNEIKNNKEILLDLSFYRKKEELDKIFSNNNIIKAINLINDLGLSKCLEIDLSNKVVYTYETVGIWAQIGFSDKYPFTKLEKSNIDSIRKVLKEKIIDNYTIYKYGSYICEIAAEILNIDKKTIDQIHNNLVIFSKNDIDISFNEIKEIIRSDNIDDINNIFNQIEEKIVYNKLNNKKEDIINYVKEVI